MDKKTKTKKTLTTKKLYEDCVTEAELSDFLGISDGKIRVFVTEGTMTRAYRGLYNKDECIKNYIGYLREIAKKRERNGSEYVDYNRERARLTKLQADKAELELDIKLGGCVQVDIVKAELEKAFINMRAKLLSLPTKITSELAGASTPSEIQKIIKSNIYEALDELVVPDFKDDRDIESTHCDN